MTQHNSLNVKLSHSQLNKLKSAIKNKTEVFLRLSSNMTGDDETNVPHKLLSTNRQVSNPNKAFANYLSTDIKLSKTQLSKIIQSGEFLGRRLDPLLKTGLPLIKNVIKPLAKSVLIPLGYNSHETPNMYPNLSVALQNKQQFRLNKINEIKDYFVAEIKERKLMSKRLSKYIASFDYFYKSLTVLSVTTGSMSIASFETVIGTPVGKMSASFNFAFSIKTGIVKKLLKTTRNKKKKAQ